jgi:membrane protein DedA with SNARE-associated domain
MSIQLGWGPDRFEPGKYMETLLARLDHLEHWQIAILASSLLFQGFFLAIFPEEVIITTLGLLWSQSRIGFFEAWLAVSVGMLPANAVTVFMGSRLGMKVFSIRPFRWILKKEPLDEALEQIRHYGKWIVFFTRFLPIIRGPIYFAAGMSQMGVLNFMRTDFMASWIQIPALLWVGCLIGKNATSMMDAYGKIGLFIGCMFATGILIRYLMHKRTQLVLLRLKAFRAVKNKIKPGVGTHLEP